MGDASLSESPEEEDDNDSPDRENCSPQTALQEPLSPTADDWTGSPRKRTQTLPVFNCPLMGMAAKTDALNRWSRINEGPEEKCGTLSEDIFKILDLRSSGSFFGGTQSSNKEGEDRLTTRRGSDNTTSSTASFQKPVSHSSDSKPAPVLPHQKSAGNLTATGSGQQVNSKSEQKTDSQQLINR